MPPFTRTAALSGLLLALAIAPAPAQDLEPSARSPTRAPPSAPSSLR